MANIITYPTVTPASTDLVLGNYINTDGISETKTFTVASIAASGGGTDIVEGTGTTNFVAKWLGTDTIGDSVIFDNGFNVGIGTTAPGYKLDVNGDARLSGAFYDSNNLPGTAGKVLSSTGAATSWIEPSSVITRLIPYFQTATPGGSDTYTQSNNVVDFDWSGGSGTYEYILPSATAIPYRTIRFVNNSTITASDKIRITAPSGETIDGGAFYEINKPYNGCAVWSDGVQWIVIQAKG